MARWGATAEQREAAERPASRSSARGRPPAAGAAGGLAPARPGGARTCTNVVADSLAITAGTSSGLAMHDTKAGTCGSRSRLPAVAQAASMAEVAAADTCGRWWWGPRGGRAGVGVCGKVEEGAGSSASAGGRPAGRPGAPARPAGKAGHGPAGSRELGTCASGLATPATPGGRQAGQAGIMPLGGCPPYTLTRAVPPPPCSAQTPAGRKEARGGRKASGRRPGKAAARRAALPAHNRPAGRRLLPARPAGRLPDNSSV